jgi:curved DNA-binding protein CbpA
VEERRRLESKVQQVDEGDLYRILDLAPASTARQVKGAYFGLVKQFHPDRYYGRLDDEWEMLVTRLFRGITRAYEMLIDPKRRQRYDTAYRPSGTGPVSEEILAEEVRAPAEAEAEGESVLTQEELNEFLRREQDWMRERDAQASAQAQALFEQAQEVLEHPDPDTLPLAPLREAYKAVAEAALLMPEHELYVQAQQRLRELYEKRRAYYHYRRGLERLEAGELRSGYQDLKDAVMYDPRTEHLLALVTAMLDLQWDLERAELLCQGLVDEEPDNGSYRLLYGRALAAQGRLKEALSHLHLAARLGLKAEAFQLIEKIEHGPVRRPGA